MKTRKRVVMAEAGQPRCCVKKGIWGYLGASSVFILDGVVYVGFCNNSLSSTFMYF